MMGFGMKINQKNDPLLWNERLRLTSENGFINIYKILSNYDKNASPLTHHYHLDKGCRRLVLRLLKKKYKTIEKAARVLLENLEVYRDRKYVSGVKEKWRVKNNLLKGNITLEYARVLSLILGKNLAGSIRIFNKLLSNSKFLIANNKKIKSPLKFSDLNNELVYLAGVISGDGHIEKSLDEMKIVDGHHNKSLKIHSYKFLNNVDKIIKKNFHCKGFAEEVNGNYFVFRYSSSLVCRIMNYIYEIPAGNKSREIKVPRIVKNTEKECLFWRGIFDADGCIRPKNKAIRLTTLSKSLHDDFLAFCRRKNIILFNKKEGKIYNVLIAEESIPIFVRAIGSSHPRKQKNLMQYLRKGASYCVPVNKKPNKKLERVINYLRPYRSNVYIRLTDRREMISQEEVRERINFIKKNINYKIIEVKRPRRNNHYYICSKDLQRKLNKHYEFKPQWSGFCKEEIEELKERWRNYG